MPGPCSSPAGGKSKYKRSTEGQRTELVESHQKKFRAEQVAQSRAAQAEMDAETQKMLTPAMAAKLMRGEK